MSRIPIRVRLTVVFALALVVVLTAVGALLYIRVGDTLTQQVDAAIEARRDAIAEQLGTGARTTRQLDAGEEELVQLVEDGEVVAATPGSTGALTDEQLAEASVRPLVTETSVRFFGEDESVPARIVARPFGEGRALVVGASLEEREETLDGLVAALLIGGALALVVGAATGYLLAGVALRPTELMRRQAEAISARSSGSRLPLPHARDEIRRLGETLNAMLARLDEGLRRERRFVADAGHELRTPLALLQTELELALRRPRTSEELEAALRSASEEVDRLTRLAEDLLVLASTEDGALPLSLSTFPIGELLDGAARRFSIRAKETGRELAVSAPHELAVRGDRLRLEQAVANLVDNAFRHGAGRISLDADRSGDEVVIQVSDEGEGFDPRFVAHAFERFSRADEARSRGGAGLGLAIVSAVARAHGGTTEAEGSRVSIRLPDKPEEKVAGGGKPPPAS